MKKINKELMYEKNAGAHNSVYRGKDITSKFYDGTLTKEIKAGTFDDIFIGDYIIGKSSGIKYLVADIDYRYGKGDTECTTHHILMIPDIIMETAQMNTSNVTTGAYVGSAMYTTNLATYKTTIINDFESDHILTHRNYLQNAVTNGYESAGTWYDSTVELMNEAMVYGCEMFHNMIHGTNMAYNYTIDNSQLALFRLNKSHIIARNSSGGRYWYWLRSVTNASCFCVVGATGLGAYTNASNSSGVRPAFLIY